MTNESALARTLVELADNLVENFDVVELLTLLTSRCVEVLGASAAGLLVESGGELRVMASSSDAMRLLELFELQANEGPCSDCFRTGEPVSSNDAAGTNARWPRFGAAALDTGFRSVHAVPMRWRDRVIGALNLFGAAEDELQQSDIVVAQAFADIATIAILQHRYVEGVRLVAEQLQGALSSRVAIEQAKGLLAERLGVDVDRAFALLRGFARRHNRRLTDVASDLIDGTLTIDDESS